jgi:alanine racemase
VAKAIFASEHVEELALEQPAAFHAASGAVFPWLAKYFFVRERPGHARYGKSEDKQPRDLNAERHNHLP